MSATTRDPISSDAVDSACASTPVLLCSELRKRYEKLVAVDGVGFQIAPGETYGLLGPNGAGKTTTISMLCGLLRPDSGRVEVAGQPLTTKSVAAKAVLGYVPQELALYPDMTGRENLRFFARLYSLRGRAAKSRVEEVLEVIGLTERGDDLAKDYSGGMQRRLNVGLGLLHNPQVLILDEPTAGVDPQSRNAILASIEQLGQAGIGILYTTHYMEEAERLCDRIGIIDRGKLIAEGTHRELVALVGGHDRVHLGGSGNLKHAADTIRSIEGVLNADGSDSGLELVLRDSRELLPMLLQRITEADVAVTSVEVHESNLETVFLHLTGRALRD